MKLKYLTYKSQKTKVNQSPLYVLFAGELRVIELTSAST